MVVRCIEVSIDCAAACTSCADADLGESDLPELVGCISLCLDCADICEATGRIVTRQTASDVAVVRAAVEAWVMTCRACREECERTPSITSTAHCAQVCSRCEQACNDLLESID